VSHVPEPRLLDVLEGRGATDRAHVDACAQCRARLAEAQAGLALAAGAEVPEPSPVYWESLRRQVSRRVDEESERRPAFWRRVSLGHALAAAAVLAGIATFLPVAGRHPAPLPEPPLPEPLPLPPEPLPLPPPDPPPPANTAISTTMETASTTPTASNRFLRESSTAKPPFAREFSFYF